VTAQDFRQHLFTAAGIVRAQRFAIRIADERRAIHDLRGTRFGPLEVLRFGEEGEPTAKGLLVVIVVR